MFERLFTTSCYATGAAAAFISRINGCYYNVMGLPLHKFCAELSRLGFRVYGGGRGEVSRPVDWLVRLPV